MENVIKENWDRIIKITVLDNNIPDIAYKTWLRPMKADKYVDGLLFVVIPGMQMVGIEYIRKKYAQLLEKAIKAVTGIDCTMVFALPPDSERYTFDTFKVESCNFDAYVLAASVAKGYYQKNAPVLMYGPQKSGKTHLLKAIKNYMENNGIEKNVHYIQGEAFFSELLWDIQKGTQKYIEKYAKEYELFLIDDIDYIPSSITMQEKMTDLLTKIVSERKQMIITSNKSFENMDNLSEKMKKFLLSGEQISINTLNV